MPSSSKGINWKGSRFSHQVWLVMVSFRGVNKGEKGFDKGNGVQLSTSRIGCRIMTSMLSGDNNMEYII